MLIDIMAISLDVKNFRHRTVNTEREAISALLSDEKSHKVYELAEDIVELEGLDPSVRLIVTEDPNNTNQYIVLEGNRRIAALKTLSNPLLAVNLPTYDKFRQLSPIFLNLGIKQVDCVVLSQVESYKWIKRKHYNAMGGRGTIEWGAIATARADAAEGRPHKWMIALDQFASAGHDYNSILEGIATKTTTVERVLGSAQLTPLLGIAFDIKNQTIIAENADKKAAIDLLKTMFVDMADKSFTVNVVEDAKRQTEFLMNYAHLSVRATSAIPAKISSNNSTPSAPSNNGNARTGITGPGNKQGSSNVQKTTRDRKTIAEKGLIISNNALNKLYNELRKLNVEKNPHIASAMIRIFLEKSTMVFLEDMNIPCSNPKGWRDHSVFLRTKVDSALHHIDPNNKNTLLKYARDIANGTKSHAHSLEELNRAIHDHKALPAPSELITVWDRLHPYFQKIFETLAQHGK